MKTGDIIHVGGIGKCKVIVVNRHNENGINEPYEVYEPIKKTKISVTF